MNKITLFIFSVMFSTSIFAQTAQVENIKASRFSGIRTILSPEDESVVGYYTHYMASRDGKGLRTYEFSFIDNEISKVTKAEIQLHVRSSIKQTVFNGQYFYVSYDDYKNKENVSHLLDKNGKIVKTSKVPNEKNREPVHGVYASKGDGFYIVKHKRIKGTNYGYTVTKVDNNLKELWHVENVPEKGGKRVADIVSVEDRFVIWEQFSPKGRVFKPVILCYDAKTGKKIYSRDGYDGESTIMYNEIRFEDNGDVTFGGGYINGEKMKGANIGGVYLLRLDAKGKDVLYTKTDMKTEIQPVLKATNKGFSLGSKDKVLVEDIILEGDNIYVISEMFKKNILMVPNGIQKPRDIITGKYIGDISSYNPKEDGVRFTMEIMDYIIFKYNSKGKLEEIKTIPKTKHNKITVYPPYSGYYGMALARTLSAMGWFDYSFTGMDASGTKKVLVSKDNAHPRRPEVFMYTFDDKYTKNKINLKQESKIDLEKGNVSYFNVLRAKAGKIAVVYYQRKLRTMTMNLENIE